MRKTKSVILLAIFIWNTNFAQAQSKQAEVNEIVVSIDLMKVKDDKVYVTVVPPKIEEEQILYSLPKIVPGTYSEDNYGKYIEDFKALDSKGKELTISRKDDNTWLISKAKSIAKITYLVNDTFDTEKGGEFGVDIFSPAGTNIDAGFNYMINTHGFVGYFKDKKDLPYRLNVTHPEVLWGATSMTDLDDSKTKDTFVTSRYAELVENPIMYSRPDFSTFKVNGMDIQIAVYSPTGKVKADDVLPELKKMMTAQKIFLGDINSTQKYTVLLYLSTFTAGDAKGFGALEHPTATTVVLPEMLPLEKLQESLKDVVSHEFFHIVTPLTIHSNEIHYFDYNAPRMSKHLWMYEGVTEYFANLFQINQGLISEDEFYNRLAEKIEQSKTLDETMPFTTMSANVLKSPYKEQYLNVYEKGALIGMCIDIIIREKSNGKRGILSLMGELSEEYGITRPFNDEELFSRITTLTYPEVGDFLETYVAGTTPIPYNLFLEKVGVTKALAKKPGNIFLKDKTPFIKVDYKTKEIYIAPNIALIDFYKNLDLRNNDIILSINDKLYDMDNVYDMITESQKWKENDFITIKIKRDGQELILTGNITLPYEEVELYQGTDKAKLALRTAWLKG